MVDIEAIKKEYNSLLEQLSDPELISDWEKFQELSKKKNSLEQTMDKIKEIEESEKQLLENRAIFNSQEDPELSVMAETEISILQEKINSLKKELENITATEEKKGDEPASVIMEIRAGTGGEEAALFVGDLFNMYSRFAAIQGWSLSVLDSHENDLGGFKEIVFELKGPEVWAKMQFEAGVHRVQRIPETEKNGRIHTSTASVAALPKAKSSQLNIRADELKIDFFRSSGPGGQNVNKRETAVRITHLPTGISVASQKERNQLKNKENAMKILEAKILEKRLVDEEAKMGGARKKQIGGAKRAEKIRTYNYPQDRITDHRIKKSWHNIEKILAGEMSQIVEALQNAESFEEGDSED